MKIIINNMLKCLLVDIYQTSDNMFIGSLVIFT